MTVLSRARSSEPMCNLTTEEGTTAQGLLGAGTGSFSQLKATKRSHCQAQQSANASSRPSASRHQSDMLQPASWRPDAQVACAKTLLQLEDYLANNQENLSQV